MWRLLLEAPPSPADRDHALRLVGCATRQRALEERFGYATIGWYGMTETVGVPIVTPLGGGVYGRVGRAADGYALRVRTGEGDGERDAAAGEVGRLEVRGRIGLDLMAGYLDDEAATRAALHPDPDSDGLAWLRTGDLVERDEGGWVRYVERAGDVIRRGGENVSAAEVERALSEHPAVREAAAVGLEDPILGQRVAAAVILKPGASAGPAELTAHCARLLADFKVPSEIRVVAELPRSTLDKVSRAALRRAW
jgi:crotonobetaine/carnitine-CoA ligase